MDLLIIQVVEQPLELRIFKIVVLNLAFFYEIIAVSACYVVVLVQFELSV